MPTIRLTQLAAEKQTPPKSGRVVYWDRLLPGFGLRLTPNGARSWVAMYRVDRKAVMQTLGSVAKIPRVEAARQLARDCMAQAAAGENPVIAKRRQAARQAANTVQAAAERYLGEGRNARTGLPLRGKTEREWRRIFEHDVLPRWGARPLAGLTKPDVPQRVHDKAARRDRYL